MPMIPDDRGARPAPRPGFAVSGSEGAVPGLRRAAESGARGQIDAANDTVRGA